MSREHKYRSVVKLTFFLFFLLIVEIYPHNFFTSLSENWTTYVLYVKDGKVPVLKNPSDEADTIRFVYYRDKILVVEQEWGKLGWKKVVYPVNGFIREKSLMTFTEKKDIDERFKNSVQENEYSKWEWEVIYCKNENVLVKENMDNASATIGLLRENEKVLIIKEQFKLPGVWVKSVYPERGFVKYSEAFAGQNYPYFAVGASYGAFHMPYEKNLKNYFNPLGGYLEYSRTKWNFGIRFGYNHAESRITTFFIKTDQIFAHIVYKFYRLFNNKLELYAFAGANYWYSSFENRKYESGNSFFKLEKDKGPGYTAGGGIIYNLSNFFIEAQYNIFGSRQAEFGNKPELGSFSNYSTLYPGSNHFEIIFGYRFVL